MTACALAAALLLALGGCSGGGSSVGPRSQALGSPGEPPPSRCIQVRLGLCQPPDVFNANAKDAAEIYRLDPTFANQWGLDTIRAHWAYAHVNLLKGAAAEPGSGVTLGFVDSGIDVTHPMFHGKTVTEQFLPGASNETGEDFSHGTAVASVAAGSPLISPFVDTSQGVAWGANVAMFAIPIGSGDDPYAPITAQGINDFSAFWAETIGHVLAWQHEDRSVDFLNLSLGVDGGINQYNEEVLRANFGRSIAVMAQADAGEDKTVFVWAAGNAHGQECNVAETTNCVNGQVNATSPEMLAGLPVRIPELRDHSIAVVAVSPVDGKIADFSNRCGLAREFCLAAPGEEVSIAYSGPDPNGMPIQGIWNASGTSFAAPMVTGGLAIMKQLFRNQLPNTALVERLLETAHDSGPYADRSVYGRGLMDLQAATHPVGALDVPMTSAVGGTGAVLRGTGIRLGPALGGGLRRTLAGQEIAVFDTLGAPFWFGLDDFASAASGLSVGARPVGARLGALMAPRRAPALGPGLPSGAEGGHLVLGQAPTSGAVLAWRPLGAPVGLHVGWFAERQSLLGSWAVGAFGTLAADAAFGGIQANSDVGRWRIGAGAEVGTVNPAARNGLFTDVSPLTTSAFTLHASRAFTNDRALRLSVSQPLRVEQGQTSLRVPIGRTKGGAVVSRSLATDLVPSGRQIDIAAQWAQPLAVGELRLGAVATLQPGHRAAADPELTLLSGWPLLSGWRWMF
jgi:hypothetical protein